MLCLVRGMIDELMQRENYVLAKKLLDVSHAKQVALSSNLANVETPGYKRQDISVDFDAQLRNLASKNDLAAIRDLRYDTITDTTSPSVRPDGNNVQMDNELLLMQKNSVQYEFLTQYTSNSLKQLKMAITGRV